MTLYNPFLQGTLPIRLHSTRFYGHLQSDGQRARVAGIVCADGELVALSLVGYETTVSSTLASLWARQSIPFLVAPGVEWKGPRALYRRAIDSYQEFSTQLPDTREVHYLALPHSGHILEGILHPPDLPQPDQQKQGTTQQELFALSPHAQKARQRFLLGNWDEETPNIRSFLGHLYAMRLVFLHRDHEHSDWPFIWADELWKRGLTRKLIESLPDALGGRAWKISGDLPAWTQLVRQGVQSGWLPYAASMHSFSWEAAKSDEKGDTYVTVARTHSPTDVNRRTQTMV